MKPDMFHLKKQALSSTPVGNWEILWKYKNQIKSENNSGYTYKQNLCIFGIIRDYNQSKTILKNTC